MSPIPENHVVTPYSIQPESGHLQYRLHTGTPLVSSPKADTSSIHCRYAEFIPPSVDLGNQTILHFTKSLQCEGRCNLRKRKKHTNPPYPAPAIHREMLFGFKIHHIRITGFRATAPSSYVTRHAQRHHVCVCFITSFAERYVCPAGQNLKI